MVPFGHGPSLRLDKFLWFVRLAPNRSSAQALAERGIVRLNGRRIDRAHAPVRIGDLITFPHGNAVRVIRVEQLPLRRGPASEAETCYSAVTPGGEEGPGAPS
ncbi:S4 domain-containing protein [Sphingobium lignivorans]|uniref:Ribosome-associated heat shock protein Hsp15 n=1 Tax=Sphingobium lignivorans TaxID=2735886 RepID=A0ABR6NMG6_9SPHN|nr:ribosome-associated heat shock protein Hsp15 [Sphingobium lignivorans]